MHLDGETEGIQHSILLPGRLCETAATVGTVLHPGPLGPWETYSPGRPQALGCSRPTRLCTCLAKGCHHCNKPVRYTTGCQNDGILSFCRAVGCRTDTPRDKIHRHTAVQALRRATASLITGRAGGRAPGFDPANTMLVSFP